MAQIILCGGISIIPYIRRIYQLACVLRQNGYTVRVIDSFPWIAYLGLEGRKVIGSNIDISNQSK